MKFNISSIFCRKGGAPEVKIKIDLAGSIPGFENKPVFQVKRTVVGPAFFLNGKPFFPVQGRLGTFTLADKPLNVRTVGEAAFRRVLWTGDGKLDSALLGYQAEKARRILDPDTWFIWSLTVYPPKERGEKHPDEVCKYNHGKILKGEPGSLYCAYSFETGAAGHESHDA